MSKEIYKEYLEKFWIECKNSEERRQLNNMYHYKWSGSEIISGDELLNRRNLKSCDFIELYGENVSFIRRKPKTQMINGHEVVAPRYDLPERDAQCFWINSIASTTSGYAKCSALSLAEHEKLSLSENGWFDNEKDVIAYVNAHRENKNE